LNGLGRSNQLVFDGAAPHPFDHHPPVDEAAVSMPCLLIIATVFCRWRGRVVFVCIGGSQYNCDVPGDLDRDPTSISLFSTERFLVRLRAAEDEGESEGRSEEAEGGDTA
jgi:hypothetical protein